jgi:molecular chaperone DnaK
LPVRLVSHREPWSFVQAGVLGGEVKDVLLLDVTPLTLGIETMGGVATPLIEKNTTIPSKKSQVFSTAADNQTQVEINVVQGERPMANDNKSLGRFILDGIPPAPRGVPQVEVTFDIDASGILSVTAKDKATGKEQSIKITGSTGLTDEEIKKMTQDAEMHADEDAKKKELIEVKNSADNLIFTAEKSMKDMEGKIEEGDKKEVEDAIEALKKVKDGEDKDEIEAKTKDLSEKISKIGEKMYSSAGSEQAANTSTDGEGSEDAGSEEASSDDKSEESSSKKEDAEEGEVVS